MGAIVVAAARLADAGLSVASVFYVFLGVALILWAVVSLYEAWTAFVNNRWGLNTWELERLLAYLRDRRLVLLRHQASESGELCHEDARGDSSAGAKSL